MRQHHPSPNAVQCSAEQAPPLVVGIHDFKMDLPLISVSQRSSAHDPIPPVAKEITDHTHLLCFDEFQVRL